MSITVWVLGVLVIGAITGFGFADLLRAAGKEPDLRFSTLLLLVGISTGLLLIVRTLIQEYS